MTTSSPSEDASAAQARLDRLERYLQQDPGNAVLLADAFETALRCSQWARAEFHLRHGQALRPADLAWALREGDFWLAQREHAKARAALEPLLGVPQPPPGFAEVLLHNLAFVDFQDGDFAACVQRLAPRLAAGPGTAPSAGARADAALQQLWLRALHHAGEPERALAWALAAEAEGRLGPQIAGVASLAALDAEDFTAAQRWSEYALARAEQGDAPAQALVTQASLALAARDAAKARHFADAALQLRPSDGRSWSARAFADLLAGDFATACRHFARALADMPRHIGTWHGQGWAQLLQQDFGGARASFESALALDRNFAESHGGLAVALVLQRQATLAQEHVDLAMRLDRGNLSGRYAQALLSGKEQDMHDIRRLAEKLLAGRGDPRET